MRLIFYILTLVFIYLAAKGGTGVETFVAVVCAVTWNSTPKAKYTVVITEPKDQRGAVDHPLFKALLVTWFWQIKHGKQSAKFMGRI